MSDLPPGKYHTASGSEVLIREKGGTVIEFDWFEEDACIEAEPWIEDRKLLWSCDCCGEGEATLIPSGRKTNAQTMGL